MLLYAVDLKLAVFCWKVELMRMLVLLGDVENSQE